LDSISIFVTLKHNINRQDTNMDYQEILEKIKNKDRSGLEALYNQFGQKFYVYAVKKWRLNEDESWEVVYQTLDTLILKLSGYDFESEKHFQNFIFKVFINYLRQKFRYNRNRQLQLTETLSFDGHSELGNGDETINELPLFDDNIRPFEEYYTTGLIENPKLIALKKALSELSETERDILLLRAQNYSYDEISSMLKIENKQLKVKHHRSKVKLIQLLNKTSPANE